MGTSIDRKYGPKSFILIVGIAIMPMSFYRSSSSMNGSHGDEISEEEGRSPSSEELVRFLKKAPKNFDIAMADPRAA